MLHAKQVFTTQCFSCDSTDLVLTLRIPPRAALVFFLRRALPWVVQKADGGAGVLFASQRIQLDPRSRHRRPGRILPLQTGQI